MVHTKSNYLITSWLLPWRLLRFTFENDERPTIKFESPTTWPLLRNWSNKTKKSKMKQNKRSCDRQRISSYKAVYLICRNSSMDAVLTAVVWLITFTNCLIGVVLPHFSFSNECNCSLFGWQVIDHENWFFDFQFSPTWVRLVSSYKPPIVSTHLRPISFKLAQIS